MFVCIRLRTKKTPFDVLVFTLPSKVNLIWTRAIRPVIAQSAQFGEIAFSQIHFSGAPARAKRARSGAPWVRKFGKLSIRENLVMT